MIDVFGDKEKIIYFSKLSAIYHISWESNEKHVVVDLTRFATKLF